MKFQYEMSEAEEHLFSQFKDDLLEVLEEEKENLKTAKKNRVFMDVAYGRLDMIKEICEKFGAL